MFLCCEWTDLPQIQDQHQRKPCCAHHASSYHFPSLTGQPWCPSTVRPFNVVGTGITKWDPRLTDVPHGHISLVITTTVDKTPEILSWGHGSTALVIIQNLLVFISNISVTKQLFMMLLNSAWALSLTVIVRTNNYSNSAVNSAFLWVTDRYLTILQNGIAFTKHHNVIPCTPV